MIAGQALISRRKGSLPDRNGKLPCLFAGCTSGRMNSARKVLTFSTKGADYLPPTKFGVVDTFLVTSNRLSNIGNCM